MDNPIDARGAEHPVSVIGYEEMHRQALLDLSIRAWTPVFPLMKTGVPDFVYESFYPHGWETQQRNDIAEVLDRESQNIDVAMMRSKPVGWVCTRIHHADSMAEVYVLAVDPAQQRSGVGHLLLEQAYERTKSSGMRMVMVETGDDPGHAPARGFYESAGFVRWPVARYFKDLHADENRTGQ